MAAPMAQILRERAADDEFKAISGINADLLAMQDKNTSGRAMAFRIRQGILILSRVFQNFRYTKEIAGRMILQLIPELFDVAKLSKVLGPRFLETNQIKPGQLEGYMVLIKERKYDVVVTEADNTTTNRLETFESLMELAKVGYPVPLEILLEYMNVPNTEELKQQIQQEQERQANLQQTAQAGKQGTPATQPIPAR